MVIRAADVQFSRSMIQPLLSQGKSPLPFRGETGWKKTIIHKGLLKIKIPKHLSEFSSRPFSLNIMTSDLLCDFNFKEETHMF
jgi:hypothetical protein